MAKSGVDEEIDVISSEDVNEWMDEKNECISGYECRRGEDSNELHLRPQSSQPMNEQIVDQFSGESVFEVMSDTDDECLSIDPKSIEWRN